MIAGTVPVPAALNEATAIVEAEWIRLTQEMEHAEGDIAATHQDLPAPRAVVTPVLTDTAVLDRCFPMAREARNGIRPAWLKPRVWATQRAPPEECQASKMLSDKGGGAIDAAVST